MNDLIRSELSPTDPIS